MATTIYEPALERSEAAALIERCVGELYDYARPVGRARRVARDNLTIDFMHLGSLGIHFRVRQGFDVLLQGTLDPSYPGKYAEGRLDITRWVRGRWEETFGVPINSYDPHWDDRIPSALKKAIREAASAPGSAAAKRVVDLMFSYADGTFEDVLDCTLNGDEHAGELACWVVTCMRGPNMAAMVALMMWVNAAVPGDVLRAYSEAHHKYGVRRRHLREILGTSDRVSNFIEHVTSAAALERSIEILREMPRDEATKLIGAIAPHCGPLVQQMLPEGLEAFLHQFLTNPNLRLRTTLARRRSGLLC